MGIYLQHKSKKTGISRTYLAEFVQKNMSRRIQYGEQLNIYS